MLVNLGYHLGRNVEAKCIAVNQLRPHLVAVGANDSYIRLYDRRMINTTKVGVLLLEGLLPGWDRDGTSRKGRGGCVLQYNRTSSCHCLPPEAVLS